MLLCVLSGFVAVFLAQITFCLGLKTSEAKFTAPWMLLNPIFVTILAIFLKYETNRRLKTLGLSLSLLGTIGLILLKLNSGDSMFPVWEPTIFLFISSLSNATGVLIWRILFRNKEISSLVVTTWSMVFGSIFMLAAYLLEPYWLPSNIPIAFHSVSRSLEGCQKIMSCCFVIMLGYGTTYAIMTWATRKSSISIVALYASARPMFTVVLSFIIKTDDPITTSASVGLFTVVLCGLVLSSYSKREDKQAIRLDLRENKKKSLLATFEMPVKPIDSSEKSQRLLNFT
jgi:drug/metabolite transporter (DMT)-like permease